MNKRTITRFYREGEIRYGAVEGDVHAKARRFEPNIALSLAKGVKSSPDSENPSRTGAREIYNGGNGFSAKIEVGGHAKCQRDVTDRWNELARTWFPKYVVAHRKVREAKRNYALSCDL